MNWFSQAKLLQLLMSDLIRFGKPSITHTRCKVKAVIVVEPIVHHYHLNLGGENVKCEKKLGFRTIRNYNVPRTDLERKVVSINSF